MLTAEEELPSLLATMQMERFELTPDEIALLHKQVSGRITAEEALRIVFHELAAEGITDGYVSRYVRLSGHLIFVIGTEAMGRSARNMSRTRGRVPDAHDEYGSIRINTATERGQESYCGWISNSPPCLLHALVQYVSRQVCFRVMGF